MTETDRHPNGRRRHAVPGPTEKMREYLEVIYYLTARQEPVISARLAEWMHVTPPTVTVIVRRLEESGYIQRDTRGEIRLTDDGWVLAEAMVKRHRILERFLVDIMGVPWHMIHEEAVRLEHALSPLLESRIEALVSGSTTCPHGNPIPGSGAGYQGTMRLSDAEQSSSFTVLRIVEEAEEDTELMEYLQTNDLVPGARFEVASNSASYGVTLRHGRQTITVPPQIAGQLWGQPG